MPKLIIDASAWIEYLQDTPKGKKIAEFIEKEENQCFTPASVVAEIISKAIKSNLNYDIALTAIINLSNVYAITNELSILSGKIHNETKKINKDFGMLDAFVIATARKLNAKVITCDLDFKQFKESILI